MVDLGGDAAGDGIGPGQAPLSQHFHSSGRVVERDFANLGVTLEKHPALRQRHGMGVNLGYVLERCAGWSDEVVHNAQAHFAGDVQVIR